ncbi:hypothetical protein [Mycobacterium sp.]|uniref:hypothetical protein n=1 Tax=Mycobacterium sp. TaxID=1785 RepID=UPI003F94B15F
MHGTEGERAMGIETIRRSGVEQPVGYVAEGWVEAGNLVTADEEFVAEAETLKDPAEIGALCQQTRLSYG